MNIFSVLVLAILNTFSDLVLADDLEQSSLDFSYAKLVTGLERSART